MGKIKSSTCGQGTLIFWHTHSFAAASAAAFSAAAAAASGPRGMGPYLALSSSLKVSQSEGWQLRSKQSRKYQMAKCHQTHLWLAASSQSLQGQPPRAYYSPKVKNCSKTFYVKQRDRLFKNHFMQFARFFDHPPTQSYVLVIIFQINYTCQDCILAYHPPISKSNV